MATPDRALSRTTTTRVILLLVLFAFINLPLADSWRRDRQIGSEGVTESAAVMPTGDPADRLVVVTLPEAVFAALGQQAGSSGPSLEQTVTRLEPSAYEEALAAGTVPVRYLPGDPTRFRVEGADRGNAFVVVAVMADLLLLLFAVFLLRYRDRMRPEIHLQATADLRRCPPAGLLERQDDGSYLVAGEVLETGPEEVLLQVADRKVRVFLAGHANPVGHQQPAEARGVIVG